jgi:hypothetical protein
MSIQQQCGLKAQEVTSKIMEKNGSNAFQKSEAIENAYKSAVASYDATLAANKGITTNEAEASEAAFSSSVVASSVASVTSTLILNTIVSNTSLLLLEKFLIPDNSIEKNYKYYWDKYPDLFGRIQIVYTDVDENGNQITDSAKIIENNIKYLNEYFNKGYRLFIGFTTSTTLAGVLPWFINTGAKGISINSASDSLNFVKPVYRLKPTYNNVIDALKKNLVSSNKIYYIYTEDELACESILEYLKLLYPEKLISYMIKIDGSNLTLENIQNLYKDVDNTCTSLIFLYRNTQLSDFINLFSDSYPMPTTTFDIVLNNTPEINESSKNAVVDKYNFINNVSFSTSLLYRNALDDLKDAFLPLVANSLLLINKLAVNGNIKTLPSENSVLQFKENNDIKYFTFLNKIYSKDDKGKYYYKEDIYYIYDPIVGKQDFPVNRT